MFQTFLFKTLTAMLAATLGVSYGFPPISKIDIPLSQDRTVQAGVNKFASCTALKNQIAQAENAKNFGLKEVMVTDMVAMPKTQESIAGAGTSDFSQTNVQVQGVDEADIVKQDGEYIYHLTGNTVKISRVYPPNQAELKSSTKLDQGLNTGEMYISGNRLVLTASKWDSEVYPMPLMEKTASIMPPWRGQYVTIAQVWDISDRSNPKKMRTIEFNGSLSSSRLIAGKVYLIMNSWSPWDALDLMPNEKNLVPAYKDSRSGDEFIPMAGCAEVSYFDPRPTRQYLAVASVPVSGEGEVEKEVILGSSDTIYSSLENLYVARQEWSYSPVRDSENLQDQGEKTIVYKFALKDGKILFQNQGSVQGRLLNQFSLDEFESNLRIATTKVSSWDLRQSTNNVFILDSDMKPRGDMQGIAPGETIYSVRFMGKKGYMVTFRTIDPLFVFDLSNPDAPKILGKLKIPGYSDYLHPMDENHLIGVGKNAVESEDKSFAWQQGMKMAVFDVSDVENPKELWKTEIGDRGTDSPALHNHKAFLYSAGKQLLALPIQLAELPASVKNDPARSGSEYGDFTFQGAYIYRLTLDKGFELLGRISHHENTEAYSKSGYYWGEYQNDVDRILYADDTLITASDAMLQFHHLYDLNQLGQVKYPQD